MSISDVVVALIIVPITFVAIGSCGSSKTLFLNDESAAPMQKDEFLEILQAADRVAVDRARIVEYYARRVAITDSTVVVTYTFESKFDATDTLPQRLIIGHSIGLRYSRSTMKLLERWRF